MGNQILGGFMGNVLDITSRLNKATRIDQSNSSSQVTPAQLVDLADQRKEVIKQERRQVKRTILTEFVAAHVVVPGQGLLKVQLYDLTEKGLAFDVEAFRGAFAVGESISLRVYLNYQTYFPLEIQVKHVTLIEDEGVYRHGGELAAESENDIALHHFVKFMESISTKLRSDKGDVTVSKINS